MGPGIKKIVNFYVSGFKSMTVGKYLWIIIIVKLFIMFAILNLNFGFKKAVYFFHRRLFFFIIHLLKDLIRI